MGRCFAPRAHLRRCPRLTTSCPCRGKSHPASSPAVVRASFHSPLHRLASPRKVSRRAPSRSCRGAWKGDRDASGMEMVAVRASFHSPLHRRAFSMLRGLSKIIFSGGRRMGYSVMMWKCFPSALMRASSCAAASAACGVAGTAPRASTAAGRSPERAVNITRAYCASAESPALAR